MEYSNELYHYGVIGMKWGVRKNRYDKYNRKAEKELEKSKRARTNFGKYYHGDRAADFREMARTSKKMSEAKTFKERFWTKHGNARKASIYNAKAEKSDARVKNSGSKLRRAYNESRAYNLRSSAKARQATAAEKGLGNKIETSFIAGLSAKKMTMGGKTRSNGQAYVENILFNTAGNIVPGAGTAASLYRNWHGYRNRKV